MTIRAPLFHTKDLSAEQMMAGLKKALDSPITPNPPMIRIPETLSPRDEFAMRASESDIAAAMRETTDGVHLDIFNLADRVIARYRYADMMIAYRSLPKKG